MASATPRAPAPAKRRRAELQPGMKNWLRLDGVFFMGPRYAALLEAVDCLGSIRAACDEIGMSYRTCLNRVRRMEQVLGHPVLETRRGGMEGGGARLTPGARAVLRVYNAWRSEARALSDAAFARALARAPELAAKLELARRPHARARAAAKAWHRPAS